MEKKNEVIEGNEQETPFHLLPQEEQQRIIDANQKRVREAQTLHEWNIQVPTAFAWFGILFLIGIPALIGGVMIWNDSPNGWVFIIVGAIMLPYLRYLVMADKDYHYRLTTEGLVITYHDAIPEVAYTIVRGLVWLGLAWFGLVWRNSMCHSCCHIGATSPSWGRRHGALCCIFH